MDGETVKEIVELVVCGLVSIAMFVFLYKLSRD